MARFVARKFVGCFIECAIGAGIALTADLVWQSIRGNAEISVLEASSAALGGCATGCLKPWNWVGSKGATLGKKVKQKTEVKNVHKPYSNPKQSPKYGKTKLKRFGIVQSIKMEMYTIQTLLNC